MGFSENHSQALSYILNGYFLSSYAVVILHAQICSVVRMINYINCSSVASQRKRMRYCDEGLQNNSMLVITPVMK